jgi:osmotically-inducible protein OsmY
LGGKAKDAAEKELATKFVDDVKGVKGLNNLMTIE